MTTTIKRRFTLIQRPDLEGFLQFILTDEDKQLRMGFASPKTTPRNEDGVPHDLNDMVISAVTDVLFKEANPEHPTDCPQCKGSGFVRNDSTLAVCDHPGCDALNLRLDWSRKNPLDEIAEITYTLRHEQ